MGATHQVLIIIGGLLLLGLVTHVIGQRTSLPRVTLLMVLGVAIGPSGFGLLPPGNDGWFTVVADMALVMIGFLLGERLTRRTLVRLGRPVLAISISVVAVTALVVGVGLSALGLPLAACLLLAGIATSTAPAATVDVVEESKAKGPFTDTLLAVVAVDDAWGLMLFSLLLASAQLAGGAMPGFGVLAAGAWEVGGAIVLGLLLGIPMAYLTGRIEPGEPTLAEALGVVFLCGGLAIWLEVSFLLAAMTLGAAVANLAKHHTRPFHAIAGVDELFLILFFVLAGASLDIRSLASIGLAGAAFVLLRVVARVAGAAIGGAIGRCPRAQRGWMGAALMPQAGVALGMALLAAQRFPELADQILPIVIASTVIFELFGPIATRTALRRVGETTL